MLDDIKHKFMKKWTGYFPTAALPIAFYYTDDKSRAEPVAPPTEWRCLIAQLARVRHGRQLLFDMNSIGCGGGRQYAGFDEPEQPGFEHFLSCGIPGKIEGLRYKKTPEMVREQMDAQPEFKAPGKFIVFKRWDMLDADDDPRVVIFFSPPDIISALYNLANFDETDPNMVITPTGSGCSQIIYFPYHESQSTRPRCILGMFDLSARPYVPKNIFTFAAPLSKFLCMIDNMDESFLITDTWKRLKKRI